uniref:Histone deacetylase 5 n=1 Tax=Tanacetum cinerariifolium TaxID=118510 RepID=A0A6L2M8Y8_TANCI|nr:histone deacetylase 5 [Tanacetum cinerariifolium]
MLQPAIGDPLGGYRITPNGFAVLLKKLMEFSSGKIIMALERGYNLESLENSILACDGTCVDGFDQDYAGALWDVFLRKDTPKLEA